MNPKLKKKCEPNFLNAIRRGKKQPPETKVSG